MIYAYCRREHKQREQRFWGFQERFFVVPAQDKQIMSLTRYPA